MRNTKKQNKLKQASTNKLFTIITGLIFFVFAAYISLVLYLTWPISEFSINKAGVFGDSFGVLTSLFSGLAFAGLIWAIFLQKQELRLQRKELELTRKEFEGQRLQFKVNRLTDIIYKQVHHFHTISQNLLFELPPPHKKEEKNLTEISLWLQRQLENIADDKKEKLTKESANQLFQTVIYTLLKNSNNFCYVYNKLSESCNLIRYILITDELDSDVLNELKNIFFINIGRDFMRISGHILPYVDSYIDIKKEEKDHNLLFDPIFNIKTSIGNIISYKEEVYDIETIQTYLKQKDMYSSFS
jgi:hypothetical protein